MCTSFLRARMYGRAAAQTSAYVAHVSSVTVPAVAVDADPLAGLDRGRRRPVPVTAGSPYSRQTIAAWLIIPPMSVTMAAIGRTPAPSTAP